MAVVFSDDEVAAALDGSTAVAAMREALLAAYDGRLVAPPRATA
ncbi:ornithine cyclodeaminase family protein, partial [Micromonospora zhanjiangensis]